MHAENLKMSQHKNRKSLIEYKGLHFVMGLLLLLGAGLIITVSYIISSSVEFGLNRQDNIANTTQNGAIPSDEAERLAQIEKTFEGNGDAPEASLGPIDDYPTLVTETKHPNSGKKLSQVTLGAHSSANNKNGKIVREVYFTTPKGKNYAVHERVFVKAAEQAADGATIRLSMFKWASSDLHKKLIAAFEKRNIDVKIIIGTERFSDPDEAADGNTEAFVLTKLQNKLGENRVLHCYGGCGDDKKTMHNKYMTISKLKNGAKNVVILSSANVAAGQRYRFNSTLVTSQDKKLYQAFRQDWTNTKNFERVFLSLGNDDGTTRAYFFPKTLDTQDTIVTNLNRVECSYGDNKHTQIRVGSSYFTRMTVAEKLAELKSQGCSVQVITMDAQPTNRALDILEENGVKTHVMHLPTNKESQNGAITDTIHSKYLLINGWFAGEKHKVVFAGSHNFNVNGLYYSDDAMQRIFDNKLYDAFQQNWKQIRDYTLNNY